MNVSSVSRCRPQSPRSHRSAQHRAAGRTPWRSMPRPIHTRSSSATSSSRRAGRWGRRRPSTSLLMTLGKAGAAGDGPDTFNQPSDVVVAPNGDIFVADGHGGNSNARIVKFSKGGAFIKAWGKKGSGPGEFDTPHSLAMDSRGRLFVADRGNSRIQIFEQDGTLLD